MDQWDPGGDGIGEKHDLWPTCEGGGRGGILHTILSFAFGSSRKTNHEWAIRPCTTFAIHIGALRARGAQAHLEMERLPPFT